VLNSFCEESGRPWRSFNLESVSTLHPIRATSHATLDLIIAGPSEMIGAKTKTSLVVAECGSRSTGVKNQAAEKTVATISPA
jgi:hypothetical protein